MSSAMRNGLLLRNTEYHRMRREVVLLFIYRLYIFTLLNMLVIILVNILGYILQFYLAPPWCENHWPKARSTSIAFAIDRLGTPALSDNGSFFFKHSFLIYLGPQYLLIFILFKQCDSPPPPPPPPPPHYFTSRCVPSVPPNFLICFANKRSTFHNFCSSFFIDF